MNSDHAFGFRLRRRVRRAYTLVELIVVITIIAILIAVGIPAFSAAIESSDKALAENQLAVGLATARAAAIQTSTDTAAYFSFTPGGRLTITTCVKAGQLEDWRSPNGGNILSNRVQRDVFVPYAAFKPVQMPRNWSVRGFAGADTLHQDTGTLDQRSGWYVPVTAGGGGGNLLAREFGAANVKKGNWVFPETGFFPGAQRLAANLPVAAQQASSGASRNSFIVRFRGSDGGVDLSDSSLAIVIDPADSGFYASEAPWNSSIGGDANALRIDKAADRLQFVRSVLALPTSTLADPDWKRKMFGWRTNTSTNAQASPDRVLVRPITEFALYNERSLARALGARGVNVLTATIYGTNIPGDVPSAPFLDGALLPVGSAAPDVQQRINGWIEGRLPDPARPGELLATDARVFTVRRYLGSSQEILP